MRFLGVLAGLLWEGTAGALAQRPSDLLPSLTEERTALGAAFVGGRASGLEQLLHPDLIVQPPDPDSARRGAGAIRYLTGLAVHTQVTESRLWPQAVNPEGTFLLEQGTWVLQAGVRAMRSRYHLRWRNTRSGWKVVLWRWTAFR